MRPAQEFGEETGPGLSGLCMFSLTKDAAGMCGKPAVEHAWPGSPPDTRESFTIYSCADHIVERSILWDWHATRSGACAIPGAMWRSGELQGDGRCVHEDFDEDVVRAALLDHKRGELGAGE
ncbi:hypothetical protein SEA_ALTADENA_53 [Arthrobacter phage Altadena]|uniref:Uncharacterized protein n=1 Tax=Arthrobacter phage Altadena TaxID=3059064 RepID=A0AA96KHM8_9CAUD|nr:hypothetical protein SEA_ALTADENA_53 [Arthrobacter phage Altadena]